MSNVDPSYLLIAPIMGAFLGAIFSFIAFWALNQINTIRERAFKELETINVLYHDMGELCIYLIAFSDLKPEDPSVPIFFFGRLIFGNRTDI